ncbi:MAG: 3-methyl-2-oxobutanoate hydroxymethyltransferase [Candidatus Bathyarchaeota archaeon]|nr:3-methyl-2-oxobutanoate hydroxymethyltransferase [Candidatus Bathyarchaeota archaeon]MCZ2845111.1 3-methyl-2-oxobutanoate hydroxymethyltransferase [Candidatus Bathyarchaeota archaeon]
MERKKITIRTLLNMKKNGKKIVAVSMHDYPIAVFADMAEIDVALIGDGSVGMTALGYGSTVPVTMDEMLIFCKAVVRGAKYPLIIGDMPFMSYATVEEALRNAGRFMKEAGVDAVKLEGGIEVCDSVKAISDAGIPVVGHIGLTPQSASLSGGYKIQGTKAENAKRILDDAIALEQNGSFAIVIEFATAELAKIISKKLTIPVLGWGSGPYCDGIGLNICDILGLSLGLSPKFAKEFANLHDSILNALNSYKKEIQDQVFPTKTHSIHMDKTEYEKLLKMV